MLLFSSNYDNDDLEVDMDGETLFVGDDSWFKLRIYTNVPYEEMCDELGIPENERATLEERIKFCEENYLFGVDWSQDLYLDPFDKEGNARLIKQLLNERVNKKTGGYLHEELSAWAYEHADDDVDYLKFPIEDYEGFENQYWAVELIAL